MLSPTYRYHADLWSRSEPGRYLGAVEGDDLPRLVVFLAYEMDEHGGDAQVQVNAGAGDLLLAMAAATA